MFLLKIIKEILNQTGNHGLFRLRRSLEVEDVVEKMKCLFSPRCATPKSVKGDSRFFISV